ncbi:DUF2637 domain-containing protein [Streptomyces ardesiacus]|uniref:DUF2637 domain-containing protein n=1 Tax=Streptomyces TaxID=1883 RepID=UPI00099CC5C4|nr:MULTISPECIES: DUF2637 domain-containing protein [Streptomyces]
MTKHTAERAALMAAGAVIVVLTAGAFWLSYAHLADVAGQHGLGSSPVRRWAWPATLDAFIVAGELLMLRAGLRRVTDRWAIAVTVIGSVGSIALNVAGVSGTGSPSTVSLLDYVVAAVPPLAAMLAFAVLMRQIHQLVERPSDRSDPVSTLAPEAPVTDPDGPVDPPAAASATPQEPASGTGPRSHDQTHPARGPEPEDARTPSGRRDEDLAHNVPERPEGDRKPPVKPERKQLGKGKGSTPGRKPDLTDAELRAIALDLADDTGLPSVADIRAELKKRNRKAANHRVAAILDALKAASGAVRIPQDATGH